MYLKKIFLFLLLLLLYGPAHAGPDSTKTSRKIYFGWGYNRDWYTLSTIHFQSLGDQELNGQTYNYDFRLYDAKAHDRPDFDQIHDVINFTIPQFNARAGFYYGKNLDRGWEMNYDHAKYVVTDYQTVHYKGQVNGHYEDKDTLLDPQFIHFEHSDGANFWMFNYMRRWKLYESHDTRFNIGFVVKPGIGFVYPRTDVTIFGHRLNNHWKVAGVIAGVETGFRAELFRHFYMEYTGKAAWADYVNCLVQGKGFGKATHNFGVIESILTFGYQIQ
jgi:hypothetical protein